MTHATQTTIAGLFLLLSFAAVMAFAMQGVVYRREHEIICAMHGGFAPAAGWTQAHASYYGQDYQGQRTANGETFDRAAHTAACDEVKLGTVIRVRCGAKSTLVRVNDRLGWVAKRYHRQLDLSEAAFADLAPVAAGVVDVEWSEVRP